MTIAATSHAIGASKENTRTESVTNKISLEIAISSPDATSSPNIMTNIICAEIGDTHAPYMVDEIGALLDNDWQIENSSQIENANLLKNTNKKSAIAKKNIAQKTPRFSFMQEEAHHDALIEALNAKAFGPARFTRAAHLIREDGGHDMQCSFVVENHGELVASIRMTAIKISDISAYLLGPLVVSETYKGAGLGGQLIQMAINAAKTQNSPLIILVGDAPYYGRFGFHPTEYGQILMPAPVAQNRLLALELQEGALIQARGMVMHQKRAKIFNQS